MSISTGLVLLHALPLPAAEVPGHLAPGYRVVHATGKKLLDELALIVARLFNVPICLVLLDAEFDWLGAAEADPPPRPGSLCAAAIAQHELMRLEAAGQHPSALFSPPIAQQLSLARPLVQPLLTGRRHAIGALCLIAATPRSFEAAALAALTQLAALATLLIELRASAAEAQAVVSFWQQVARELAPGLSRLLIAANQLRQAANAADRDAAWLHVQQTLTAVQQRLS